LDTQISKCIVLQPQDAHKTFWEWLCEIAWMNQKTANLFLKYAVTMQQELEMGDLNWRSWEPYLHVPLDMWVLRLMSSEYLGLCNDQYEVDFTRDGNYMSPTYKKITYVRLQNDIAEVAKSAGKPAIMVDILWFVGNKYCGYYNIFCNICWLKDECHKYIRFDYDAQQPLMRADIEKERKQEEKKKRTAFSTLSKVLPLYLAENLDKTEDDFSCFIFTPEGEAWLRSHNITIQ